MKEAVLFVMCGWVDGSGWLRNLNKRRWQQHGAEPNVSLPHVHWAKEGIYWQQRWPARNPAGRLSLSVCVHVFVVVRLYSISAPPGQL